MEYNQMNDSYLVENNSLNSYHIQNSNDQSPRRSVSPLNDSRSRSRSFDRRSNRRSYSRSRSPRNRNTNEREQDYSNDFNNRDRQTRRNETRGNRNQTNSRSTTTLSDRELGLKYRWEKTVFISNIPYDVKWPELKDLFRSKIGEIHFCEVFEKDGKSMGVGSIEFKLLEDAEKAVELMNQYDLGTRKITVRMDSDGSRTRKAKEMSKDFKQNGNLKSQLQQDQQQTANLLASLNQANLLAALGLSNTSPITNPTLTSSPLQQPTTPVSPVASNPSSALNTPNLINLLTTLAGANVTSGNATVATTSNSNNNNLALLNQIAQQNKIEGSVTNRIFIASLDYKVDEHKIREVFNLAGKVQSVSLFKDRDGKSRGMSVVEYATPLEALNAILMFNNQVLNSRAMNVRFDTKPPKEEENLSNGSQLNSKLPTGLRSIGTGLGLGLNLQQKANETPVNQLAGLDALTALTAGMNTPTANPVNSLSALAGLAGLTSGGGNLGLGNLLGSLNTGVTKSTTTTTISKIFIKNIPFSWDERKLKEKFRQAGPIEFVEIKHRDGKSRGCGLIKFSTPDQASKAVELFNGSRFEGRTLEVKLDQLSN